MTRGRVVLSVLVAVAVAGGVAALLWAGAPGPGGRISPSPGVSGSPPPSPAPAAGLKAPLAGLVDRSGPPPQQARQAVRSWVVNVNWRDLQPAAGGPIAPDNAIDRAIAAVRDINRGDGGLGMRLRLRVFAGRQSPSWALNLGGPAFAYTDSFDGKRATVPRYWTPAFGRAYDQLQRELAARYDGVPEIAETVMSRCTSFYPEPLLKAVSVPSNITTLLANGYTAAADIECQKEQIDSHRAWTHTLSGLAFNPYQWIASDGTAHDDEATTEMLMADCRQVLGRRCVLENYSIRGPITRLGPVYGRMFAAMKRMGPPIAFQTAVDARIGDIGATLQWAAFAEGADSVELAAGYRTNPAYSLAGSARAGTVQAGPAAVSLPATAARLEQNVSRYLVAGPAG